MEQTQPFNIQSHLVSLQAELGQKQDELRTEKNCLDEVLQTIQNLQQLQEAYQQNLWQLEDFAQQEKAISNKFKIAETQDRIFNLIRQDPKWSVISRTPAEKKIMIHLDKMEIIQYQINNLVSEMNQMEKRQIEMKSLSELNQMKEETEDIIQSLTADIEELTQQISNIRETLNCLYQQQKLDQDITQYIYYIYYYWKDDSPELIHRYLITSGEHQNVPFTEEDIQELVDFINCLAYENITGVPEKENRAAFESQIRQQFGHNPELIVAFAHTLHLQMFPEDFFDRQTGFGQEAGEPSNYGVDPWQAQHVFTDCMFTEFNEKILAEARQNWERNPQRFHFSFHQPQDGELETTKQLLSVSRFLKDYWRYQNFFDFTINQVLYLYPRSVSKKEQSDAYKAYKKKRVGEGTYLLKRDE